MRFYDILGLVLCVISFNLLAYLVGFTNNVAAFLAVSLLHATLLALTSVVIFKDIRKGLAITYLSIALVFIYAYNITPFIMFKSELGRYLLLMILLISSIAVSIITLRGGREASLAQTLILLSLPAAILDSEGLLPIGLMAPHILFLRTVADGLKFNCISFLIYLPHLLLPIFVVDIMLAPHINLCNVLYGVGGELNLLITMLLVNATFLAFSIAYHKFLKYRLPKVVEFKYTLPHSLTSYTMSLAMMFVIPIIADTFLPVKPFNSYLSMLYASIPSFLISLLAGLWSLEVELTPMKNELNSNFQQVRDELNIYTYVLDTLATNPVFKAKIGEYRNTLDGVGRQLNSIKAFLSKPTFSQSSIINTSMLLMKIRSDLAGIRGQVVSTYESVVNEIKELYKEYIGISGLRDAELDELIILAEHIRRFEDIPSISEGLTKALKKLCELYVETLDRLAIIAEEVLGAKIGINTLTRCPEEVMLLSSVRAYRNLLKSTLSSGELVSKLFKVVDDLSNLKNSIDSFIREYSDKVSSDMLSSLKELSNTLTSLQHQEANIYALLTDMVNTCNALRNSLSKLVMLVNYELTSRKKALIDAANTLKIDYNLLTPIPSNVVSKLLSDLTAFQEMRTCYDVVNWISSKGLGFIYSCLLYVEMYGRVLHYIKYLQLVTKYFDEMLERGSIVLDDIPLSKDFLKWFVNVYVGIRKDVVLEGNTLIRRWR